MEDPQKAKKSNGRGPGRPPKPKIANINTDTYGIVTKPNQEGNILEVVYDNPQLFKTIWSIFIGYGATEIILRFSVDRIDIIATDPAGDADINIRLHGAVMSRYYCKEPITRTITRTSLQDVFKGMSKSSSGITFLLNEEDSRSKLHTIIRDKEHNLEFSYTTDIVQNGKATEVADVIDVTDYPISFPVPLPKIKEIVKVISKSTNTITFSKALEDPMCISYEQANRTMSVPLLDANEPTLVYKLDADDIFAVSITLDKLKPFITAPTKIDGSVEMWMDKFRPMCFKMTLDKKKVAKADSTFDTMTACEIIISVKLKPSI